MAEEVNNLHNAIESTIAAREAQAQVVAQETQKLQSLDQALNYLQGRILITDNLPRRQDFEGLSLVEAARRWLAEVGEAKTTKEIADEILARGVKTTSRRFVPNVYASLNNSEKFVRRKDKWQLKEAK